MKSFHFTAHTLKVIYQHVTTDFQMFPYSATFTWSVRPSVRLSVAQLQPINPSLLSAKSQQFSIYRGSCRLRVTECIDLASHV